MGKGACGTRLAGVALAFVLAGCGGAAAKPAESPGPADTVRVSNPPPAAAEASSAPPRTSAPPAEPVTDTSAPARPTAIPDTPIRFLGGDGSSVEQAIVIHGARGEQDGVAAEYWYVGALLGKRGVDWQLRSQALLGKGGHQYDMLDIADGHDGRQFYFDITEYFGKF